MCQIKYAPMCNPQNRLREQRPVILIHRVDVYFVYAVVSDGVWELDQWKTPNQLLALSHEATFTGNLVANICSACYMDHFGRTQVFFQTLSYDQQGKYMNIEM